MTIQHALDFIREVEHHSALKDSIRQGFEEQGLAGIVQIGADLQLHFDVQELRSAFGIDWAMRVLHAASHADNS